MHVINSKPITSEQFILRITPAFEIVADATSVTLRAFTAFHRGLCASCRITSNNEANFNYLLIYAHPASNFKVGS